MKISLSEEPEDIVSEGLMTVAAASEFLSIGRSKLYDLMDSGELRYVKLGRSRRIPRRSVHQLAAANLTGVSTQ